MNRRVAAFLGLVSLVLVLLVPAAASAQTTTPTAPAVTVAEVRAKFGNWTQLDAAANGYARDQYCIAGPNGAMGFHAVKESLVDGTLDPLNPEALLIDGNGNVVGVEYVKTGAAPTAKLFPDSAETQTWAAVPVPNSVGLHLWFITNPAGLFAPFNQNVTCPAGSTPPAGPTPTPTPRAPVTGDATLPGGLGLYLAIFGVGAVAVGIGVARRSAARN